MEKLFIIMVSLITGPCDVTNADYEPLPHCDLPGWVSNYIPFNLDENGMPLLDENGKLTFPTESNYQCQHPCNITGTGMEITLADIGYYAACMQDLLGWRVEVDGREIWCVDSYGDPKYREPFYHDGMDRWVVGFDILTHESLGYLTYDWEK